MKISRTDHSKSIVLNIEGSLSVECIHLLQEALDQIMYENRHVLLEFSKVTFIDSSTLGLIVLFFTKMAAKNRHLVLSDAKPEILQMLNLTGVSKRIQIFKTAEDALNFINGI